MYSEWWQVLRMVAEFGCLAAAVVSDFRSRKVKNRLVLAGVLLATVLAALAGPQEFWNAVAGGTAALAAGFVLWKLRVFRAGDAKLLWMTMQFAGWEQWTWHMSAILLVGGLWAMVILLRKKIFVQRLRRLGAYLCALAAAGRYTPYEPEPEDKVWFPFAGTVLAGELVAWLTLYLNLSAGRR